MKLITWEKRTYKSGREYWFIQIAKFEFFIDEVNGKWHGCILNGKKSGDAVINKFDFESAEETRRTLEDYFIKTMQRLIEDAEKLKKCEMKELEESNEIN